MVQFGKEIELRRVASPEYAHSYLDYKRLKKIIKSCPTCQPEAANRVAEVTESDAAGPELNAAMCFCRVRPASSDELLVALPGQQLLGEERAFPGHTPLCDAFLVDFLAELQASLARVNDFVVVAAVTDATSVRQEELIRFAETNRLAVVKIVKKFQKKCGPCPELQAFVESLPSEPFLARLAELLRSAEESAEVRERLFEEDEMNGPTTGDADLDILQRAILADGEQGVRASRSFLSRLRQLRFLYVLGVGSGLALFLYFLVGFQTPPDAQEESDIGLYSMWGYMGTGAGAVITVVSFVALICQAYDEAPVRPAPGRARAKTSIKPCTWERLSFDTLLERGATLPHDPASLAQMLPPDNNSSNNNNDNDNNNSMFLEGNSCSCCLSPFTKADDAANNANTNKNSNNDVALLRCGHFFCEECIVHWSQRSDSCPLCRASFAAEEV